MRRSSGHQVQGVINVSFCVGRCWIFCIGCDDGLLSVTHCLMKVIGKRCGNITLARQTFYMCHLLCRRLKVGRAAKSKIDVEREKSKGQKPSEAVASSVIRATFNPFIEIGQSNIRYVAKDLIKHPSFKSVLVMGTASFDYSTLFVLPRSQAIECYRHLFQSFSSRW